MVTVLWMLIRKIDSTKEVGSVIEFFHLYLRMTEWSTNPFVAAKIRREMILVASIILGINCTGINKCFTRWTL